MNEHQMEDLIRQARQESARLYDGHNRRPIAGPTTGERRNRHTRRVLRQNRKEWLREINARHTPLR